ncbi:hypothetical protein BVRB_6g140840 [Beta vulgaris subsp. vulgaris]|nr:hypothetical protein BVRB_6g140840 [Beta vulgaris subsp. vulgaris]
MSISYLIVPQVPQFKVMKFSVFTGYDSMYNIILLNISWLSLNVQYYSKIVQFLCLNVQCCYD